MTTKGYKTSEFWLALAAVLVGAVLTSGALPAEHWGLKLAGVIAAVLASLGYTAGRAFVKGADARATELAKVVDAKLGPTK